MLSDWHTTGEIENDKTADLLCTHLLKKFVVRVHFTANMAFMAV